MHLDIINRSLSLLGEKQLTDLNGTDMTTQIVKSFYDSVWETILASNTWIRATKKVVLTGVADESGVYTVNLPEDFVIIKEIKNSLSVPIRDDCFFYGNIIESYYEEITLLYVSKEGIIPLETVSDPSGHISQGMERCVEYLLANYIGFKFTQNVDLINSFYQKYLLSLDRAIVEDYRMGNLSIPAAESWDVGR